MAYWTIGLLAALILAVVSKDVLWKRDAAASPVVKAYRRFLFGVMAYYIFDALWGLIDLTHLTAVLYADTVVYFIAMAASVLLWTKYVVVYLDKKSGFSTVLVYAGWTMLLANVVALIVNFFTPVFFWFDANGAYQAGIARYATLAIQVVVFLLTAGYTLSAMVRHEGAVRRRYWAIGLYGLAMAALVAFQIAYPLLPLYAVGYLLGTCVIHAFVVEGEKDEYRQELENMMRREQQQKIELDSAKQLAYSDPLTGVKSKHAYAEAEARMERGVSDGSVTQFAVAVFDLNGLKRANDTMGHEAGDVLLKSAAKLICDCFKHSPVFRIGGDEFVAILEGQDYQDRTSLLAAFDAQVEENARGGEVVVSSGMAEFNPLDDAGYHAVFGRADDKMYLRKMSLEEELRSMSDAAGAGASEVGR